MNAVAAALSGAKVADANAELIAARRAIAHTADKLRGRTMSRRTGPHREADTERRLAVYDGRVCCVSEIEERGRGRIVAYAIDKRRRIKIGEFANRVATMRAISRVRG